jgi:SAM-dependent methyltransferase
MPDYRQIYAQQAEAYHRLVSAEDYLGELPHALARVVALSGARVLEIGMGTGRITRLLLEAGARVTGYEQSPQMLAVARRELGERFQAVVADVRSATLPANSADVALAGWALGHFCEWHAPDFLAEIDAVLLKMLNALEAGGTLIVVETLGTGSDEPRAPNAALGAYYEFLEEAHGMRRETLRTDYRFASLQAMLDSVSFFFGPELAERVREQGRPLLREWTGLWWKRK